MSLNFLKIFLLASLSSLSIVVFGQNNSAENDKNLELINTTITISGADIKYSNHFTFNSGIKGNDKLNKGNNLEIEVSPSFNKNNLEFKLYNQYINKLKTQNTFSKRKPLFENNNGLNLDDIIFDPDITYVISGNIAGGYKHEYYSMISLNKEVKKLDDKSSNNNYNDNSKVEVSKGESNFVVNQTPIANNFSIYPNPAINIVNIKSDVELKSVSIVDIKGRVVKNIPVQNQEIQSVDVQNLTKGLYIIQALDVNNNLIQEKLIIATN